MWGGKLCRDLGYELRRQVVNGCSQLMRLSLSGCEWRFTVSPESGLSRQPDWRANQASRRMRSISSSAACHCLRARARRSGEVGLSSRRAIPCRLIASIEAGRWQPLPSAQSAARLIAPARVGIGPDIG